MPVCYLIACHLLYFSVLLTTLWYYYIRRSSVTVAVLQSRHKAPWTIHLDQLLYMVIRISLSRWVLFDRTPNLFPLCISDVTSCYFYGSIGDEKRIYCNCHPLPIMRYAMWLLPIICTSPEHGAWTKLTVEVFHFDSVPLHVLLLWALAATVVVNLQKGSMPYFCASAAAISSRSQLYGAWWRCLVYGMRCSCAVDMDQHRDLYLCCTSRPLYMN